MGILEAAIKELDNEEYYPNICGIIGKNGKLVMYDLDKPEPKPNKLK